ncbi:MAG: amidase family protein, partial [Acidobacteriota bacterium]
FANVVGFRVSPGRVPNRKAGMGWFALSTAGPMARTVGDVALLLSAMAGPDGQAPLSLPEPGASFARPLGRSFRGARVAWFRDLGGLPFEPAVRSVVAGQRKVFEGLGCVVEEAEPDFAGADFAFQTLRAWNSAVTHAGRDLSRYKETLRREIEAGQRLTGADLAKAETLRTQVWRRVQAFFERYEYFVLPVTQVAPFAVSEPFPTAVDGRPMGSYIDWMRSCWYISTAGNPALAAPAGFTAEGLPVGLQIVGRDRADFSVLQLASAYEQAAGVPARWPEL